jgi:hypothetical protein
MLNARAPLVSAALISSLAFGQTQETKPAFEVADVHVSPLSRNPYLRGPLLRDGRYQMRYAFSMPSKNSLG